MKPYHDLLQQVLNHGTDKSDRTGTGTRSIFGAQMRFDLAAGFPLVTTKRVRFNDIVAELLWFISGDTNANTLRAQGVTIWDEWASYTGDLGPIYGKQWRSWGHPSVDPDEVAPIDQLKNAVERLRTHPDCRRNIVSAWNVADLPRMALAPCHCLFQFYTRSMSHADRLLAYAELHGHTTASMWRADSPDAKRQFDEAGIPARYLDVMLTQRSADLFLGVPYNIASYALLLLMVARDVGMAPGHFVHSFGDAHIYSNHREQVGTQLNRAEISPPLPHLRFVDGAPRSIFEIRPEHIVLEGYDPLPAIKAPVAI